jgi:hypothetical protein
MKSRSHYPIAVIEDRYGGAYSGGRWLAISCADHLENGAYRIVRCLEDGPHGQDIEAREFWESPPSWIAVGATPNEAIQNLEAKGFAIADQTTGRRSAAQLGPPIDD